LQTSRKGRPTFVTQADLNSDAFAEELSRTRPITLVMGRAGRRRSHAHRWFIDPLDGTTNYFARRAAFCRFDRS